MPPGTRVLTKRGFPIRRNPARVLFAAEELRTKNYSAVRNAIVERWGVNKSTAEVDIRYAKQMIAEESDYLEVRAGETRRLERIADEAEEIAAEARAAEDYAAAAAAQKGAIAASREIARLNGAYAPKEVKVTATVVSAEADDLDAILAALSPRALEALRVLDEEIEALRAAGRLQLPAHDDVEDAEIVESGGDPPAGAN